MARRGKKPEKQYRSRVLEIPHELDYYPTPPFATRMFCDRLCTYIGDYDKLKTMTVWEPACGEMHMARPLAEYFGHVRASDVHAYSAHEICDFPLVGRMEPDCVDWVITNPPFLLAEDFVEAGLRAARRGVAILVRTAFAESRARYNRLFGSQPPSFIWQFVDRVVLLDQRLVRKGETDPASDDTASSATAYCWMVWLTDDTSGETHFGWLDGNPKRFEAANDYPSYIIEGDKFELATEKAGAP
jgi:hypothetical protein